MDINTALIRKFLNKECSPEEAEQVAAYLEQNPDLLNEIYNEAEWQAEEGQDPDAETWNRIQRGIQNERRSGWPGKRFLYVAAACLVAVLGISYILISGKSEKSNSLVRTRTEDTYTASIVLANNGDSTRRVSMPDGTVIDLSAHSSVSYFPAYGSVKREVFLKGEAVFNVAKDSTRPFLVYCDRLSVQALGTVFLVNGNTQGDGIKVRLFEGKVVVKPYGQKRTDRQSDFMNYLDPGQELVLGTNDDMPYVHYFMHGREKSLFVREKRKRGTETILKPSGWFEFRSQAVNDVFKTLEVLYNIQVTYNRNDVKNMFFIGRFEPTDSAETILRSIALLNNLSLEKKALDHYVILKP